MKIKLSYMTWMVLVVTPAVSLLAREAGPPSELAMPKVRVQMSLVRPLEFTDLAYYKPLYGTPRLYPQASLEWLFLSQSRFQLGLGGSLAYSVANGFAGVRVKGQSGIPPASQIATDPNSPCTLTFLPYRLFLSMIIYPFSKSIIGIGLMAGIEESYFGETRTNLSTAQGGAPAGRTGWSKGMVVGASLPIAIAGPTSQAIRSMEIMRGHAIYLTPFYEKVMSLPGKRLWLMQQRDSGLEYYRQDIGLSFSFEFW